MKIASFVSAAALAVLLAVALTFTVTQDHQNRTHLDTACHAQTFEGSRFQTCTYDPGMHELRLVRVDARGEPLRRLPRLRSELGAEAMNVLFAMNAGMFDESGQPLGRYDEKGVTLHSLNTSAGKGNFYLKPNGVFWVDASGQVHINTSEDFAASERRVEWATQSGPMLVIDRELLPQIQYDGPSRNVRNGVGVKDGKALCT